MTLNTSHRNTSKLVGVFFILGTFSLFIGQAFYGPILDSTGYLDILYPNKATMLTGILIEFAGFLGLIFIPILLFPILKIRNRVLAWGYLIFRFFEVVLLTIAQVAKLSLIGLSQDYLSNTGGDTSYFHHMGDMVHSILYWVDSGGLIYITVFVLGALMLYYELFKIRLVPRWISVWGLISVSTLLIASMMFTLDILSAEIAVMLMIPLAIQEQVMAIWMIVKGFNPFSFSSMNLEGEMSDE